MLWLPEQVHILADRYNESKQHVSDSLQQTVQFCAVLRRALPVGTVLIAALVTVLIAALVTVAMRPTTPTPRRRRAVHKWPVVHQRRLRSTAIPRITRAYHTPISSHATVSRRLLGPVSERKPSVGQHVRLLAS